MPEKFDEVISTYFPEYLKMEDEDRDTFWNKMPQKDRYHISKQYCFLYGYGVNHFICSEPSRAKENFDAYKTIYDWDEEHFFKQKEWYNDLSKQDTNIEWIYGDTYNIRGGMYGEWIRLLDGDRFIYGSLYYLQSYLVTIIEELLIDLEMETFDFDYVNGLQLVVNPESERETFLEVQRRIIDYECGNEIWEYVENLCKDYKGVTFRIDDFSKDFDYDSCFIFSDPSASQRVTFYDFLGTFNSIKSDSKEIDFLTEILKEHTKNIFNKILKGVRDGEGNSD